MIVSTYIRLLGMRNEIVLFSLTLPFPVCCSYAPQPLGFGRDMSDVKEWMGNVLCLHTRFCRS